MAGSCSARDPGAAASRTLAELVEQRLGVRLRRPDGRPLAPLDAFVERRWRALGLASAGAYLERIATLPVDDEEFARLVQEVTNPHTYFFRDGGQFEALGQILRRRARAAERPLYIWCAGCATGEEPYSVAMLCAALGLRAFVLATDINAAALRVARRGRYRPWALRALPPGYQERFFRAEGEHFTLGAEARRGASFRQHNLVEDPAPRPLSTDTLWDAVLCRNVFIYFAGATIARVTAGFSGVLARGGALLLGAAEQLHGVRTPFEAVAVRGAFVYRLRRPGQVAGPLVAEHTPAPWRGVTPLPTLAVSGEPGAGQGREEARVQGRWIPPPTPPVAPGAPAGAAGEPPPSYQRALELLRRRENDAARACLEALVARDPRHAPARLTLGNLHLAAHRFEQAEAAYRAALAADPLLPEATFFLGVLRRKQGRLAEAEQQLRATLFLEPGFWYAAFLLAGIYSRTGQRQRQVQNLRHTLRLLAQSSGEGLFCSYVGQMPDMFISREEVAALCRRFLRQAGEGTAPGVGGGALPGERER